MRNRKSWGLFWGFLVALACVALLPKIVHADPIAFQATYDPAGSFPTFTIQNNSASGISISSVTYNLASGLFFDTAAASPGAGGDEAFTQVGAGLGFTTDASPAGSASVGSGGTDGSTSLTLNFSGFGSGDVFNFSIDVDRTTGGGGSNDTVNQSHFNTSTISVTFTDGTNSATVSNIAFVNGQSNTSVASAMQEAPNLNGDGGNDGGNNDGGTDGGAPVPEPGTILLWSAIGIGGLIGARRMRRRPTDRST